MKLYAKNFIKTSLNVQAKEFRTYKEAEDWLQGMGFEYNQELAKWMKAIKSKQLSG